MNNYIKHIHQMSVKVQFINKEIKKIQKKMNDMFIYNCDKAFFYLTFLYYYI